jgi:hypothetical protein
MHRPLEPGEIQRGRGKGRGERKNKGVISHVEAMHLGYRINTRGCQSKTKQAFVEQIIVCEVAVAFVQGVALHKRTLPL